ncbi:iron-sulfur cluster biosynthesis family protein [Weissella confusa]|nr:iron-sulfur cluster biosynthesis family protein [Weissella confusa]MED4272650.1 iron-sulfur cluster biosynthesis family protein [Weissella confusa]TGE70622.1 iron-sulfur cluster biosynthesis family protein [Weissella confusa]
MYIELDDYATNRVMNNFDPETQVILFAVEDGISPYNDPLDVTMETSFTINIVNKDVPYQRWFDMPLETSLGAWYIKSTSKSLLAENMQLRKKNNFGGLALDSNEQGRLVESVAVKDATGVDIAAYDANQNGPEYK